MGRKIILKGQIVCQHLEGVSRKALENYQSIIKQFVKGKRGVYALYSKNRLYYVGLASNLRNRLKTHLRDRHADTWDKFSVYLTSDDAYLRELETLVLKIAAPKGNVLSGKFMDSEDIKPVFKRSIKKQHKKEIDILFGAKRARETSVLKAAKKEIFSPPLAPYVKKRFPIRLVFKGKMHEAWVRKDGAISLNGNIFNSPSIAAQSIRKHGSNGWIVWRYKDKRGDWVLLDELRKKKHHA